MPPTEQRNIGSYEDAALKKAIQLLISECFGAMNIANALGGSQTPEWEVIHGGNKVSEIFAEAKKRGMDLKGLKAAVGELHIEDTWAKKYLA